MPKIKLTKTELKHQQDSLKQYLRFLPTLQLKKQQLQMEIRQSVEDLERNLREQRELETSLQNTMAIFGDPELAKQVADLVKLEKIECSSSNIAGVTVPVYESAVFKPIEYDYFATDWALDGAIAAVKSAVELRESGKIIAEQHRLLSNELRTTTQRVNLFEKVKIPECRDNIRLIRIQIGDMSTAAVARSKIAKRKTLEAAI